VFETSIGLVRYKKSERPGYYNVSIKFYKGDIAEYVLSKAELKAWKEDPTGTFYNNRIRIKGTPF
jgi:hypothetical protein